MAHKETLETQIERLYESSEQVLDDCALPNGALVAANTDLAVYPSTAENYRFSWARDAAYQLLAAHAINPNKATDRTIRYAKWLNNVQDFRETGLYIKRYGTNGTLDVRYGEQYQPDEAGALIGALNTVMPEPHPDVDNAIIKMSDGLARKWNGQSFGPTQDLWENRETTAENNDVFTYSTASVIYGLRHAIARMHEQHDTSLWQQAADEMRGVMDIPTTSHYYRKIYPDQNYVDHDNTLDASLSGLVYPFWDEDSEQLDPRAEASILAVRNKLYLPHDSTSTHRGVYRYDGDTYDGIVRSGSQEDRAGSWPLLTFWNAIALDKIGEGGHARDMFYSTVERLQREYVKDNLPADLIPEQLYPDDERQGKGVVPLAWSHAKYVLAVKALKIPC